MSFLSDCELVPSVAGSSVALGFFDGVHLGHQLILRRALALAGEREPHLTPLVYTFGNHPLSVLRPDVPVQLLHTAEERRARLEAYGLTCVADAFTRELADLEPHDFMERILVGKLRAKAVVCGANYRFGRCAQGTPALLREWGYSRGLEVQVVGLASYKEEGISSSRLRRLVHEGSIEEVNVMLGEPFSVSGTVRRGRQLGRRWGFPTANLPWPVSKITPAFGAYACQVVMPDGQTMPGVGYFGSRPTVNDDENLVALETNIGSWRNGKACWNSQQFTEDDGGEYQLYGETITVRLLKFLAPQERFGSVEELQTRLNQYRERTAQILRPE